MVRGTVRGLRRAPNLPAERLHALLRRAASAGLDAAVHAIGDRAATLALDAFEATGAHGSVEHAQLLSHADVPRFAALRVTASMQPAHLPDDRDLTDLVWGDRAERAFMARSLLDAGATLALGSDAPVARPDPWLAMAAAVWRSSDDRPGWHQEQAITAREALSASTDGQRLRVGARGDVVVVESDPLQPGPADEVAGRLRTMRVRSTICGGRLTHG
ncbi:amidohydrolase family protein [Tessaracoccus sp. HDW20]|nr:amidohydrolase family protein [Tessaracoccus coleopterorum]NHB85403.1 amidohydrolase family protein [Tessaracoccus coleopterorum]